MKYLFLFSSHFMSLDMTMLRIRIITSGSETHRVEMSANSKGDWRRFGSLNSILCFKSTFKIWYFKFLNSKITLNGICSALATQQWAAFKSSTPNMRKKILKKRVTWGLQAASIWIQTLMLKLSGFGILKDANT